jgi:hypothetical protein
VVATVAGRSPTSSVTDASGIAGHHRLGQVGHRLQQVLHRQLAERQSAQVLQRLCGVRRLLVLIPDHGTASGLLHTGGG